MTRTLCISVITYETDLFTLRRMLESLEKALKKAITRFKVKSSIVIIENSKNYSEILQLSREVWRLDCVEIKVIDNPDNVGYGAAQNVAVNQYPADYHVLMNPDVILDNELIVEALAYLEANPECSAISPEVRNEDGSLQYLCKSYPSLLDLAIRGFAPEFIRKKFALRLSRYECRGIVDASEVAEVVLVSGCFMFCRGEMLRKAGGFNERFFLYFEDFSLSLELGKFGKLRYLPSAKIVHYGGNAAKKGVRHIAYFAASLTKFYRIYGWKIL